MKNERQFKVFIRFFGLQNKPSRGAKNRLKGAFHIPLVCFFKTHIFTSHFIALLFILYFNEPFDPWVVVVFVIVFFCLVLGEDRNLLNSLSISYSCT